MTDADLRALVALCRHPRADVARRARGVLSSELQRLITTQHYGQYRALCDQVFALDHVLLFSVVCEISHNRNRELMYIGAG